MNMLGAEVNVIAPKTLMPKSINRMGVKSFTDMKKGLKDCDIVMMLRLQNERMQGSFLPSKREYYEFYGLTPEKLKYAKKDALTIRNRKKKIQGLRIAVCGDILHSRVARSNIYLLTMLGAEVNIIAPSNLMPKEIEKFGVNTFTDMKKGLKDCDIVMMLRLQNERMTGSFLSSNREYYEYYGLTPNKLVHAKPDAIIMHPGPMNRGIEIDTRLADDINKSVIKEQVELGVAVRMACLKIFCN